MIVQNADGAGEAEFPGTRADHDGVLGIANARSRS